MVGRVSTCTSGIDFIPCSPHVGSPPRGFDLCSPPLRCNDPPLPSRYPTTTEAAVSGVQQRPGGPVRWTVVLAISRNIAVGFVKQVDRDAMGYLQRSDPMPTTQPDASSTAARPDLDEQQADSSAGWCSASSRRSPVSPPPKARPTHQGAGPPRLAERGGASSSPHARASSSTRKPTSAPASSSTSRQPTNDTCAGSP